MSADLDDPRRPVDGGLKSVLIALDLLDSFRTADQLDVTELSKRLKISKSSAHRLLTSLCDRGFALRDPKTGRYQLGLHLHELGQLTISRLPIRLRAMPILEDLRHRTGFHHPSRGGRQCECYLHRAHAWSETIPDNGRHQLLHGHSFAGPAAAETWCRDHPTGYVRSLAEAFDVTQVRLHEVGWASAGAGW
ncbi:hypothetical protein CKJ67_19855 [Mycobacterium intracellulare]|uniref:helix-turn-helix domain-containing protein n=1 Tax=Mycobacterium intracellulare TaxID=1767 RepID=UPI000BAAF022|nr:helix-turn-helix domain-containing protein [Mycobacterium intracellulare]ASW96796.1 hypothetical protein CKJ67_19855 [Mycobacterium intracellulare]PBA19533.1 hypothetical protein CKJ68_19670 [Mycobacterium intracellulare]